MTSSNTSEQQVDQDLDLEEQPSQRVILMVFIALIIAMLLSSLDQTIFSTALPTIIGELGGVNHQMWVTTAYICAATIVMPIYGKLGDLMGHKWLFMISLSLFVVGSIIGAFAHSMFSLVAARAIQGSGGGGLMILSQSIIAQLVPVRQRSKYMGVMGAVFGVSAVLGPIIGGWLTDGPGWRWLFLMNIPVGLFAISTAFILLKNPTPLLNKPKLDVWGIVTMSICVTSIVLVCSWGGAQYAWTSPIILSLALLAVLSTFAFIYAESKAKEPIIPLALFLDRNFNLATLTGLCIAIAMFGTIAYMPSYLQMVSQLNATQAGFLLLTMVGGLMVTSIFMGIVASKTGRYRWMPIASTLIAAGALLLLSSVTVTTSLLLIGFYLFILGVGIGCGFQILVLIVQNAFPLSEVGTATAANNFFREIGATLGSAMIGSIFTSRLMSAFSSNHQLGTIDIHSITPLFVTQLPKQLQMMVGVAYNHALMPIFVYIIPLMLIACLAAFYIKEKPLDNSRPHVE